MNPASNAAVGLHFTAERPQQSGFAPWALEVGPLSQHLFLEVAGGLHLGPRSTAVMAAGRLGLAVEVTLRSGVTAKAALLTFGLAFVSVPCWP